MGMSITVQLFDGVSHALLTAPPLRRHVQSELQPLVMTVKDDGSFVAGDYVGG